MKKITALLKELNVESNQKGCHSGGNWYGSGETIESYSPVNGAHLASVQAAGVEDYEQAIAKAEHAFL